MTKIIEEVKEDKNDNGYVAWNENNEAFFIPPGHSAVLTVLRVLNGTKFNVIDLDKVPKDAIMLLQKM